MNTSESFLSKLGAPGWIVIFAIAMGLLAWIFNPTSRMGLFMFLGAAVPAGIGIFWMYQVQTQNAAWQLMREQGLAGTARVLQVESTNVRINKRAQVRMRLQVRVPGDPPYEISRVDVVPLGQAVTPGNELVVYVDRADHQQLIIDWTAAAPEGSSGKPDVSARLQELEALRKNGQITEDEYQAHRQRLLTEL
ncbi:hypothetical protein DFR24_0287 [Panacagrimonas perspica]|uniref:SHOCT domain-containing protein n=1 Tax=Panacagrimonas perspica TaxID=381431 RepID=A0A4R7PCH2_9GAMM|nr:SHOCT domain-containing protein [Panacagrimonas perspica]TDU30930.1 hypothetical protein DFR24_0287 [Panacagrimonas perspica]THD01918.1 hypothetical protein B1810_18135 [Panacagrimonas perspica]